MHNYPRLVDITHHRSENNLKSTKLRERATAVNNQINIFGYKHVKDTSKMNTDQLMDNWKRVMNDETYTTRRMNNVFDMTTSRQISDEVITNQILLFVNQLLIPCEICIRSYRCKTYNIIELYEFDALIKRKQKQDIYILHRQHDHSESEY